VEKITYEQPLNEKIRILLRLESLFLQAEHTLQASSVRDSRATLATLLEILNLCSRSDLKADMLKELERQAASLERLEQTPGVDQTKLGEILAELDGLIDRVYALSGQPGQALRQNEFLTSIKQRSTVPGGLCDFDLPSYHYWLQQSAEKRTDDLREWLATLETVRMSTVLILRLTRDCATPKKELAEEGCFQKSLDTDSAVCQLVRVFVSPTLKYYPEISGSKHRVNVRFMEPAVSGRAIQTDQDVEFDLACCIT
jgi:cell division protein ZapD